MSEQTCQNKAQKRTVKRILLVAIVLGVAAFIYCFFCYVRQSQSPDEKLAAIEAACSIPDSENAAIIYNQILDDYSEGEFAFGFLDSNSEYLTRIKPWLRDDYPELADWIENQQALIAKLIEASKFEKCCFPINIDLEGIGDNIDRLAPMRQLAFLLVRAANHDIAQSKTNLALEKYISVIQIGRHEFQQPVAIDYIVGIAIEEVALRAIARFIVEDSPLEPLLPIAVLVIHLFPHDSRIRNRSARSADTIVIFCPGITVGILNKDHSSTPAKYARQN